MVKRSRKIRAHHFKDTTAWFSTEDDLWFSAGYEMTSPDAMWWEEPPEFIPYPSPQSGTFLPARYVGHCSGLGVPFGITVHIEVINGEPVATRMTIHRVRDVGGWEPSDYQPSPDRVDWVWSSRRLTEEITSAKTREIPVGEVIRGVTVAALHASPDELGRREVGLSPEQRQALYKGGFHGPTRGGRRALTADHYQQVADLYVAGLALTPPEPRQHVARQMMASTSTASRWIAEAKQRGLISTAPRKRAETTEEAISGASLGGPPRPAT